MLFRSEQEIDCGQRSAERHQHVAVDIERHAHFTIPKKLVAVDDIRRGLAEAEITDGEWLAVGRVHPGQAAVKIENGIDRNAVREFSPDEDHKRIVLTLDRSVERESAV